MKRILALLFILFFSTDVAATPKSKCHLVLEEIQALAKELKSFENTTTFKFYGFAVGGPHNNWLLRAEKLRDKNKFLGNMPFSADGDIITPGDLIIWGLDRMRCATRPSCSKEFIYKVDQQLLSANCKS